MSAGYVGGKMTTKEDKAREAFEEWCEGRHSLERSDGYYDYVKSETEFAWQAYQAATQANKAEMEDLKHDLESALKTIIEYDTEHQANKEKLGEVLGKLELLKEIEHPDIIKQTNYRRYAEQAIATLKQMMEG